MPVSNTLVCLNLSQSIFYKQIEPLHSTGVPKLVDKALYVSAVSISLGTLVLCKGSILCFESKKLIQKLQKRF